MINWIKKIFQGTEDKKEWLEHLFSVAETIWTEEKSVHFRIVGQVKSGFLVKTVGLFAILPFRFMPWQYPSPEYWEVVFPTLEGKIFYCKIVNMEETENRKMRICIDATIHRFEEISLENGVKYTGVVLQKYESGMIVDIGCHFDWRCGSLTGYLSAKKVYGAKSYADYKVGDIVEVVYSGCNKKGLLFAGTDFNDFYLKYVGKTVWAKVCKDENALYSFLIEGEHHAHLPIQKTIYPQKRNLVKRMRQQWKDGDIIDCEILDFNVRKGFIIKWIESDQRKKEKNKDEIIHSYPIKDILDDGAVQQLYESTAE
jgi:ribosomal protein S1